MLVERVEVLVERVEVDVLSRFTVVVRPVLSVVFTVVRVVPLLFTRVSTEVEGLTVVVLDELLVPVALEALVVLVVLGELVALVLRDVPVELLVLDVLCVLPLPGVAVEGLAVADVLVLVVLFSTSLRSCAALCTLRPAPEAGLVTR